MPEREHGSPTITPQIQLPQDIMTESYAESKLLSQEMTAAESAREIEDERKAWWGIGLSIGLGYLLGPIGVPIGVGLGKVIGEYSTMGDGKQAEDYMVSTDVGKFHKEKRFQLEEINRNFAKYDKAELWTDIMDVGRSLMFTWSAGGGSLTKGGGLSNFSPTKWGGKGGKTSKEVLQGLGTDWKQFFNKPEDISSSVHLKEELLI